jgi:hypothetical protein
MKITIELDTKDSSGKFHPDCEHNKKLLDHLGPIQEGAAACGVLRLLALHLPAKEFANLVESGRLIVAFRVQDSTKKANQTPRKRLN